MIKRNGSVFMQRIEDEIIIHSTTTGNNLFLNETASDIYDCVKDGVTMEDLVSKMIDLYGVDIALILDEIQQTINVLVTEGVLVVE